MSEKLELLPWSLACSALIVACAMGVIWLARRFVQDLEARKREGETVWNGAAFEAKAVADRVSELRQHPLDGLSLKPADEWQRRERVALARSVVVARSYFQRTRAEWPEPEAPSP